MGNWLSAEVLWILVWYSGKVSAGGGEEREDGRGRMFVFMFRMVLLLVYISWCLYDWVWWFSLELIDMCVERGF